MAVGYNPKIVTDGLRVAIDAGNIKSYPGSGNTLTNLVENQSVSPSIFATAEDTTAGTVVDYNGSTSIVIPLSPNLPHETWSLIIWTRDTGTPSSNYRQIVELDHPAGPGYFYRMDTRETGNNRVHGYQRDYYINSWYGLDFVNATQWNDQVWWCFGVSHNNTVFKVYRQGVLINTTTQTRSVADYTDIPNLILNGSGGNTVYTGSVFLYDRVLTDEEFEQNFNALRGRHGV